MVFFIYNTCNCMSNFTISIASNEYNVSMT